MNIQQRFENIYNSSTWRTQFGRTGSGSGTGSTPEYCARYLDYLHQIRPRYATVLDLGCGDWHLYRDFDWGSRYTGVDIVPSVIAANRENHPEHTWVCADILTYPIRHELVLLKDVAQHWTDDEIEQWIKRLRRSRFRTALVTNNWRHHRTPALNGTPRDINNKYSWAPVDFTKYGFKTVLYYPQGKFKQVARLDRKDM